MACKAALRRLFGLLITAVGVLAGPSAALAQPVPVVRFTVEKFVVEGENPLSPEETGDVLEPFLGEHEGLEGLLSAADALEQHLIERGFPFFRAVLPQQTLEAGVVKLTVVAFKVENIEVNGNEHFSDANILASIPALELGRAPDTDRLSRQRQFANLHPSKRFELRFRDSEAAAALDAVIEVQDSRPLSAFLAINNTGTEETGETRATIGLLYSNLFSRDHQITLNYTRSPQEFAKVEQFGVSYVWPLYRFGGTLNAFFTTSTVDTGEVAGFDVSGAGDFVGASYTQHLPNLGQYRHNVSLGVDSKLFRKGVQQVGGAALTGKPVRDPATGQVVIRDPATGQIAIQPDAVRSRPLSIGYAGEVDFEQGNARFYGTYVRNLPGGSRNESVIYAAERAGAEAHWDLLRFGGSIDYVLDNGWLARARLDAQYAGEPLISGEQTGGGGASSVRGYDEREVSGDLGFVTAVEAWTPPLKYNVRALGYFDYGIIRKKSPQAGETAIEHLTSAGFGLRWFWRTNINVQADYARTLHAAGTRGAGDNKLHFTLFFRY